jgi:DNA-binding transcriptional LysR family regulator
MTRSSPASRSSPQAIAAKGARGSVVQLRLLQYFVTLAKEQHFARAAQQCNVTQPTLSSGIAALEEQLGKRLVVRDRRFVALTPEGIALLPWAQQILAACESMKAAVATDTGPVRGELRLGAIPASMPVIGYFAEALRHACPEVSLMVRSLTSREIERALGAFELDAGITYLDHEAPSHVLSMPLYAERLMYVVGPGFMEGTEGPISWREVASEPLCLLHQGMQNRRILDLHLSRLDIAVRPQATADSYVALLAMVHSGAFATIMPSSYGALLPGWARILDFDQPLAPTRIGVIVPDRTPQAPLSLAAAMIAERLRLPGDFTGP